MTDPSPIQAALIKNIERLRHLQTEQAAGDKSANVAMEIRALDEAIQILKEVEGESKTP